MKSTGNFFKKLYGPIPVPTWWYNFSKDEEKVRIPSDPEPWQEVPRYLYLQIVDLCVGEPRRLACPSVDEPTNEHINWSTGFLTKSFFVVQAEKPPRIAEQSKGRFEKQGKIITTGTVYFWVLKPYTGTVPYLPINMRYDTVQYNMSRYLHMYLRSSA